MKCHHCQSEKTKLRRVITAAGGTLIAWRCLACRRWAASPMKWLSHSYVARLLEKHGKRIEDIPVHSDHRPPAGLFDKSDRATLASAVTHYGDENQYVSPAAALGFSPVYLRLCLERGGKAHAGKEEWMRQNGRLAEFESLQDHLHRLWHKLTDWYAHTKTT